MNLKTKITLAFILTIFLSCSSETDEDTSPIDSEIVTITPNFGYEGDEITFEMSNPIPSNANVLITYNGQSVIVNEINGTTIKHTVPNNPESPIILTINGQEKNINSATDLRPLKKYIDCENCREKAFALKEDIKYENIIDINKIDNTIYLIHTSGSQFSNESNTSLIKTDLNFNVIEKINLFSGHPNSNILFESNNFLIQKDFELLSYDYKGNLLWTYSIGSGSGGSQNINSIVKNNSYYYLFENIIFNKEQDPIKVLKLNKDGQLVSTITEPFISNSYHHHHMFEFLTILDNKIIAIRSISGDIIKHDTYAYFVIDNNDNITKSSLTNINFNYYSNLFIEGNSIYYNYGTSYPNPNSPTLKKISLDNNNNLNLDWTRQDNGIIAKHSNKYLIFSPKNNNSGYNAIKLFNDDSFNNYDFINIEGVRYANSAKVFGNEVYLFGNRTIFFANDYHALIGKYDLNHITN
ncbi:hypothetical protein [Tenacibaculum finnmarkense]|uniref:hypothetical protein n=1 Tax=Tenacibaculum finnmarkense TaxID=2781243 RepID=UPI001EFAB61F|nr:hypothetical protein [Tenacibaculum finnmarkense]MCG8775629.1 hypothetical protein [Tenacibaculum finnmarkense]